MTDKTEPQTEPMKITRGDIVFDFINGNQSILGKFKDYEKSQVLFQIAGNNSKLETRNDEFISKPHSHQ